MAMERVVKVKDSLAYTVWSGIVGLIVFILVMIAHMAKMTCELVVTIVEIIVEALTWTIDREKEKK